MRTPRCIHCHSLSESSRSLPTAIHTALVSFLHETYQFILPSGFNISHSATDRAYNFFFFLYNFFFFCLFSYFLSSSMLASPLTPLPPSLPPRISTRYSRAAPCPCIFKLHTVQIRCSAPIAIPTHQVARTYQAQQAPSTPPIRPSQSYPIERRPFTFTVTFHCIFSFPIPSHPSIHPPSTHPPPPSLPFLGRPYPYPPPCLALPCLASIIHNTPSHRPHPPNHRFAHPTDT
ncbi:hypothetical protein C8R43DRAFT_617062 [Mycena crocata]|nr:hypothetical protein C8R43DRAFT_617062 [Mycena crocata]